jgi:hypothetical protein
MKSLVQALIISEPMNQRERLLTLAIRYVDMILSILMDTDWRADLSEEHLLDESKVLSGHRFRDNKASQFQGQKTF